MLSSRKQLYKKQHSRKDSIKTLTKLPVIRNGTIGIYALEAGKITSKQLQAIKFVLRRTSQRQAKVWGFMPLFRSVSKKPNETRLGHGKGNVKYWSYVAKPGCLIIEIKANNITLIRKLIKSVKYILSIKTMFKLKNSRWIL